MGEEECRRPPNSLVQSCVDCVHTGVVGLRLGELEREEVGELGLPSFETDVAPGGEGRGLSEPRRAEAVERKGLEQEYRPFILSEALPMVPAKLVKRILYG